MAASTAQCLKSAEGVDYPLITVAICTRNRASFLRKAVESVRPQLAADAELLVVDNGSTDETPALLVELAKFPGVRFCHEEHPGISVARNTALREGRGQFVVFLDDDAVVRPDWVTNYRDFFLRTAALKIGGAGGAVEPDFETPPAQWLARGAGCVPVIECRVCRSDETPWGCNLAVRREVALAVGGFATELGHRGIVSGAYEEADLQSRIQQAGYEYWWVTGVGILHHMAAHRMRLGVLLATSFRTGRCRANLRIRQLKYGGALFRVMRVLIGPLHCAVNVLLAVVSFPFRGGSVAATALVRAAGILGFTLGLARRF